MAVAAPPPINCLLQQLDRGDRASDTLLPAAPLHTPATRCDVLGPTGLRRCRPWGPAADCHHLRSTRHP